jgi:hypothetical protein
MRLPPSVASNARFQAQLAEAQRLRAAQPPDAGLILPPGAADSLRREVRGL